jgi:hypothetical protein
MLFDIGYVVFPQKKSISDWDDGMEFLVGHFVYQ